MSLRDNILQAIKDAPGTSFVELERVEGFTGDKAMLLKENLLIWSGVSQEAVDAINSLIDDKEIESKPTSLMVYLIDGKHLNLPLAKKVREYKRPHWLPVSFKATKK